MPRKTDALLLESVITHRRRLRQALLFGRLDDRRQVNDNVRRFIGGIVLTAVVGVGCLGFSFLTSVLAKDPSSSASTAVQPVPVETPETP